MIFFIIKTGLAVICFFVFIPEGSIYSAEQETAEVFSVVGDVRIIPLGSNVGIRCETGMRVNAGDWIRTGVNSSATLSFDGDVDNAIRVQENSLVIMRLDGYFKIQLLQGKVNAILENVQRGETFRVLTPSVVTESANSGWVVSAEGTYSTVVVVEGEAYVVVINSDGSIKKERYEVKEGYARTTRIHEDPGELTAAPDSVLQWFQDQLVKHHLEKVIAEKSADRTEFSQDSSLSGSHQDDTLSGQTPQSEQQGPEQSSTRRGVSTTGKNVAIIDGEEVDLLEYIYKSRLGLTGEPGAGQYELDARED